MRTVIFVICGALCAFSGPLAQSRQPQLPLLTKKSIVGTWEGISNDDLRVFRIDIGKYGARSYVSFSAGALRPSGVVFEAKKTEVNNGHVSIDGVGLDNDFRLRIEGRGFGVTSADGVSFDEGTIQATVTLLEKDARVATTWNVRFVNHGGKYLDKVHELSNDARSLIERARSGPPR